MRLYIHIQTQTNIKNILIMIYQLDKLSLKQVRSLMISQTQPHYLDSEEEQDDIQYIEVTDRSKIKAILKAQKLKCQIPEKQQPHTIIDKKIESSQKGGEIAKGKKFIKDDRERIQVKQIEQKQKTQQNKMIPEEKKEKTLLTSEDKTQKQIDKKYKQKNEPKDIKTYQNKKRSNVKKQDSKIFREKPKESQEIRQLSLKEKENKNKYSTFQLQEQKRNGDKIQIQIEQEQEEYDNQIYIQDRSIDEYITEAKKIIKIYDFIAVKAYANFVEKAFLVAGRLSKQLRSLKQINIPRNVKAIQIGGQGKIHRVRAAITIELSLNNLNKNHMGYQQSGYTNGKNSQYIQKRSTYDKDNEYDERPFVATPKYEQKKTRYVEKSSFIQKSKSSILKYKAVDERDLR